MTSERRLVSVETICVAMAGIALICSAVWICVRAHNRAALPVSGITFVRAPIPLLPPAQWIEQAPKNPAKVESSAVVTPIPEQPQVKPEPPKFSPAPSLISPLIAEREPAPLPPERPDDLTTVARIPGVNAASLASYDQFTAVYDLAAHTVYLPGGARLEAHSGLGGMRDDPAFVDQRDRGATPPHLYNLALREDLFHGVQALRLTPVGGSDAIFGRDGLLAHPYMLGPKGDSNGCVSFKDYDAFLQAFESGRVKKLVVVANLK